MSDFKSEFVNTGKVNIKSNIITQCVCIVEWDPSDPEPFYQPTGYEKTPVPVGEDRGKVVYCIDHGNI